MVQIDWNLLGRPADIGGAALQGYTQGRQFAQQRAREDALARYAAAPSMDALAPIAAIDPQAYVSLSKNERENAATRRQDKARGAYSTYLRQNDPSRPTAAVANALPDAGVGSPTDPVTGDVVVTAAPKAPAAQEPRVSIADIAALDPEVAASLTKHMGDLDKNERERFAQKTGVGAAIAQAASKLPYDQRRTFLDEASPLALEAGWTREQLGDFDPTDDNLRNLTAIGVGADKYLADQRQAAGQAITVRGQDVSAATTRRGQDISASTARRGQDISAATARAGQAVAMRGQDMQAEARVAPKPATVTLARTKISALNALDNQLNRVEKALANAKNRGPIAGRLPGGINGKDGAADAAIRQLAPLVRQLTRVPGEGAMSDYESRLVEAGQPSRSQTPEALRETLAGYRDLINTTRAGYSDILGNAPAPQNRDGFKVVR
ncbi:hypothetical protein V3I01_08030 [Sphingomonas sp. gentR]|uniref:hypothetical protein n=1 Tax=unclassified Sphingomonas TaxID=196159 RepID=UPI000972922F|nr:hypothetical protein [Sphingomonas sp. LK11]APX66277.1 hypothetical protein AV944_11055 [Sphingomonas sp. LK11]